jgi:hypothetical protein
LELRVILQASAAQADLLVLLQTTYRFQDRYGGPLRKRARGGRSALRAKAPDCKKAKKPKDAPPHGGDQEEPLRKR